MPKNLGLYNDDLSVPRKKDIDELADVVDGKVSKIGDETISGKKTFSDKVALNGGVTTKSSGNAVLNVGGVATSTDYIDIYVSGSTNVTRPLVLQNNSTGKGNVGIGTATPSARLEVVGDVKATSFTSTDLTASTALVADSNGKIVSSAVTSTELGYLDGVTSNIQTQLNKKLESAPVTSVNSKTGAVTLAKSDIGLGNVDNVKQYSASNPPPYPVTSVNGQTGAVTVDVELPANLVKYDAISDVVSVDSLNADTLQGHPASYFATADSITQATNSMTNYVDDNVDTLSTSISNNYQELDSSKLSKTGGTMTGVLTAQSNTNYTIAQVRNIILSTSDPTGGSNGDIWIKYQA